MTVVREGAPRKRRCHLLGPQAMVKASAMRTRVLVADDFPLMRNGFASALAAHPALDVVGVAADGTEALEGTRAAAGRRRPRPAHAPDERADGPQRPGGGSSQRARLS
jgi:hypothetical protein